MTNHKHDTNQVINEEALNERYMNKNLIRTNLTHGRKNFSFPYISYSR